MKQNEQMSPHFAEVFPQSFTLPLHCHAQDLTHAAGAHCLGQRGLGMEMGGEEGLAKSASRLTYLTSGSNPSDWINGYRRYGHR